MQFCHSLPPSLQVISTLLQKSRWYLTRFLKSILYCTKLVAPFDKFYNMDDNEENCSGCERWEGELTVPLNRINTELQNLIYPLIVFNSVISLLLVKQVILGSILKNSQFLFFSHSKCIKHLWRDENASNEYNKAERRKLWRGNN